MTKWLVYDDTCLPVLALKRQHLVFYSPVQFFNSGLNSLSHKSYTLCGSKVGYEYEDMTRFRWGGGLRRSHQDVRSHYMLTTRFRSIDFWRVLGVCGHMGADPSRHKGRCPDSWIRFWDAYRILSWGSVFLVVALSSETLAHVHSLSRLLVSFHRYCNAELEYRWPPLPQRQEC